MRITSLEVDGFGVWSGLKLDEFSDGLNVFYGPNEAGKTTLMQFIRSVLYGFSPERRRYFPPVRGGRPGGSLWLAGPEGQFEVTPIKGKNKKLEYIKQDLQEIGDQQFLVWAVFTPEIKLIEETLKKDFAIGVLSGATDKDKRIEIVNDFNTGVYLQLLFFQKKFGGKGRTMAIER